MRKAATIIILFLCTLSLHSQENRLLSRFNFDVSFSRVNGWYRVLDQDVQENDDGKAFGISTHFELTSKVSLQLKYQRAELNNVDLQSIFRLSFYTLTAGRKFKIFSHGTITPKAGISVQNYPLYHTWILSYTSPGGNVIRNIQREFLGTGSFRFWTLGIDFNYPLNSELAIGLALDSYYSASSGKGTTISSIFLNMKIFH